jgi:hypothetical protein
VSATVLPFRRRSAPRPAHPGPPPRYRSGPALTLSVEGGDVVLLADSVRIELSALQAVDLAHDLRELAADASGFDQRIGAALVEAAELRPPPSPGGAEAKARLLLLAESLDALDRGEKRATDVLRLARVITSEVRR